MKLASFLDDSAAVYGVVVEHGPATGIVTVAADFRSRFPSIRALLEDDGAGLVVLADWRGDRAPDRGLDDVAYLPPLHDAEKTLCIGVNYSKRHPVHGVVPPPEHITMFVKVAGTVVGHGAPLMLPLPPAADTFDYEGELVLVIGRAGRRISKADAFDHIAGYTIMNDGSVREWQKHSVTAGKNFFASSS